MMRFKVGYLLRYFVVVSRMIGSVNCSRRQHNKCVRNTHMHRMQIAAMAARVSCPFFDYSFMCLQYHHSGDDERHDVSAAG